eukprot:359270-Chlamydomonas_euryale.AAC.3
MPVLQLKKSWFSGGSKINLPSEAVVHDQRPTLLLLVSARAEQCRSMSGCTVHAQLCMAVIEALVSLRPETTTRKGSLCGTKSYVTTRPGHCLREGGRSRGSAWLLSLLQHVAHHQRHRALPLKVHSSASRER